MLSVIMCHTKIDINVNEQRRNKKHWSVTKYGRQNCSSSEMNKVTRKIGWTCNHIEQTNFIQNFSGIINLS